MWGFMIDICGGSGWSTAGVPSTSTGSRLLKLYRRHTPGRFPGISVFSESSWQRMPKTSSSSALLVTAIGTIPCGRHADLALERAIERCFRLVPSLRRNCLHASRSRREGARSHLQA